jgi:hypothetical protein
MLTNEKFPRTTYYQPHTTPLTPKKEMNNANARLNTNHPTKQHTLTPLKHKPTRTNL